MRAKWLRLGLVSGTLLGVPLLLGGRSLPRAGGGASGSGPEAGPPGVVFEEPSIDLGRVDLGRIDLDQVREVAVPWRRHGAGPLRVLAVQTGCGCAAAEGIDGVLPEGASGLLRVRLAPRRDLGPFRVVVRVHLATPAPLDVATVWIRGYVGGLPVIRPDGLLLGTRAPGVQVTRRLEVAVPPGEDPLDVTAGLSGLAGGVLVVPPALAGRPGRDLLVTVGVPGRVGPFEGRLLVRVGAQEPIPVPIRGIVVLPEDPEGRVASVR